jgi:hypothetical protein
MPVGTILPGEAQSPLVGDKTVSEPDLLEFLGLTFE